MPNDVREIVSTGPELDDTILIIYGLKAPEKLGFLFTDEKLPTTEEIEGFLSAYASDFETPQFREMERRIQEDVYPLLNQMLRDAFASSNLFKDQDKWQIPLFDTRKPVEIIYMEGGFGGFAYSPAPLVFLPTEINSYPPEQIPLDIMAPYVRVSIHELWHTQIQDRAAATHYYPQGFNHYNTPHALMGLIEQTAVEIVDPNYQQRYGSFQPVALKLLGFLAEKTGDDRVAFYEAIRWAAYPNYAGFQIERLGLDGKIKEIMQNNVEDEETQRLFERFAPYWRGCLSKPVSKLNRNTDDRQDPHALFERRPFKRFTAGRAKLKPKLAPSI